MSDQRLRELERRWATTRAVEGGAAYLAERLRREPPTEGEPDLGAPPPTEGLIGRGPPLTRLERERRSSPGPAPTPSAGPDDLRTRLAAAAHCGDPIACAALGGLASPTAPLAAWTAGLAAISRRAAVAAALGVVRPIAARPWPGQRTELILACTPIEAVEQLEGWLAAPAEARLLGWVDGAGRAEGVLRLSAERSLDRPLEERLADALLSAAAGALRRALRVTFDRDPGRRLTEAIACAAIAARGPLASWPQAEALFIAVRAMDQGRDLVFGPVRDANVLDLARFAVSAWALTDLLPGRS